MKYLFLILIVGISLIIVGFQFSKTKIDKEAKLKEIIAKTKVLQFPVFLDVYNSEKSAKLVGMSELIYPESQYGDNTPVVGILPDTTNYITFIAYGVGDILYPMFVTFDKKGNLIETKVLCLYEHMFTFEEVDTNYESNSVNFSESERGIEITLLSIAKGKRYREFESNKENTNPNDSLFCQQVIQTGFLDKEGKVIFDDKIIEDCR